MDLIFKEKDGCVIADYKTVKVNGNLEALIAYHKPQVEMYRNCFEQISGEKVKDAGFVAWQPKGAYYILTDVAHFMKRHGVRDDTAFAMWLIKECGVATVPGSSFYAHADLGRTKIRFCFPKTDDVLRDAGERLQKLRS